MKQTIGQTLPKLIGFCTVGLVGLFVDIVVLSAVLNFLNPVYARIISFLVAVCVTYWLNRQFVFADEAKKINWMAGFVRFFSANALGGAANYLTYLAFVYLSPLKDWIQALGAGLDEVVGVQQYVEWGPLLAVIPGTLVGLVFNFSMTMLFVFKPRPQR